MDECNRYIFWSVYGSFYVRKYLFNAINDCNFFPLLQYFFQCIILHNVWSDKYRKVVCYLDGPCCLLRGFILFLPASLLNLFVYYESYVPDEYQHARVKFENVKLNPLTYWLWICISWNFLSKYKSLLLCKMFIQLVPNWLMMIHCIFMNEQ